VNASAFALAGPACNRTLLAATQGASVEAAAELSSMQAYVGCDQINPFYTELVYDVLCTSVVSGVYQIWSVQLACAVSLWLLLFFVQAQVLTREHEGRLELALQEQRIGLKPSSFLPRKGTSARRKFDARQNKDRSREDKQLALELAATAETRAADEAAWADADREAQAEAAADEKRQWLVKNPKGFGPGEERREETLRIGHGGAAAAAAAAKKKAEKASQKAQRRTAKRTFDPDASRSNESKKGS
jgi:hypothetical protein